MSGQGKKFVRSQKIALDDVVPGMFVAEDVKTDAGGVILAADSILLRENIQKMKDMGIEHIYIEQQETKKEYKELRGKRVIVVDDALFFRHMFSKMLYRMGMFVCGEVESAEEGISLALKFKPDLLVMDIHLPGMNGIDAIKKLKGKLPDTKFLVCSTDKDKETIVNAIRAGAGDFIVKPLKWDQIEHRIINLLKT